MLPSLPGWQEYGSYVPPTPTFESLQQPAPREPYNGPPPVTYAWTEKELATTVHDIPLEVLDVIFKFVAAPPAPPNATELDPLLACAWTCADWRNVLVWCSSGNNRAHADRIHSRLRLRSFTTKARLADTSIRASEIKAKLATLEAEPVVALFGRSQLERIEAISLEIDVKKSYRGDVDITLVLLCYSRFRFEVDSAALNQLLSDATGGHEWDVVSVMVPSRRSDHVVASKETVVSIGLDFDRTTRYIQRFREMAQDLWEDRGHPSPSAVCDRVVPPGARVLVIDDDGRFLGSLRAVIRTRTLEHATGVPPEEGEVYTFRTASLGAVEFVEIRKHMFGTWEYDVLDSAAGGGSFDAVVFIIADYPSISLAGLPEIVENGVRPDTSSSMIRSYGRRWITWRMPMVERRLGSLPVVFATMRSRETEGDALTGMNAFLATKRRSPLELLAALWGPERESAYYFPSVFVEDTSGVGDVVTAVLAQLDDVQLREASDDVGDEAPATTSTATTSTAEADAADTGGDDAPPPLDLRENVAYALLTGEDLRSRLRDEHLESYAGLTLPASRQSS